MNICNPKCIYYPQYPSKTIKEYYDENGVKRRVAVFLCLYDLHRILKFEECKNCKYLK